MTYTVSLASNESPKLVIVGCGGTGSLAAEGLCRLLIHSDLTLMLVDFDRVEPHNLLRQNFFAGEVGKFKSQALAERLSRQYGRKIGYSVMPYERDLFDEPMGAGMYHKAMSLIIIGCVDRAEARRSIADGISANWNNWWLDAGNGHHSGQVLLGNTQDIGRLKESFDLDSHTVSKLPLPSLQLPALLIPQVEKVTRPRDCAEAIEDDEQSPTINQAMAMLVVDFIHRLLTGALANMGAYIDLDAGTLQTVPVTPASVARMCGLKVKDMMANKCGMGMRHHL
jgi:PRTRC genetic system ThiF family protein